MICQVIEDHDTEPCMYGLSAGEGYIVHRLSTDYEELDQYAQKINRLQPSLMHFYELVEDFRKG